MVVFKVKIYHQTIVRVTETSSRMVSARTPGAYALSKLVNQFLSESSKFCVSSTHTIYFTSTWFKYLSNDVETFILSMPVSTMVT